MFALNNLLVALLLLLMTLYFRLAEISALQMLQSVANVLSGSPDSSSSSSLSSASSSPHASALAKTSASLPSAAHPPAPPSGLTTDPSLAASRSEFSVTLLPQPAFFQAVFPWISSSRRSVLLLACFGAFCCGLALSNQHTSIFFILPIAGMILISLRGLDILRSRHFIIFALVRMSLACTRVRACVCV